MTSGTPRLLLQGIRRQYGSVVALDDAGIRVMPGQVHALLGENGAGKSTLMKIAFGLEQPDRGTIRIDGTPIVLRSPATAMAAGIGMVQQHFALVDAMTVAENVALASTGRFDLRNSRRLISRIGEESGLQLDPDAIVRDLPVGAQQRLEIVRALSRQSRTLILDEPTAVLAPAEATALLSWARRFADGGGSVVLIAHKLREILSIADDVTVLRRGRTALVAPARETDETTLATAMLGESTNPEPVARPSVYAGATDRVAVLRVEGVSARDDRGVTRLSGVTFTAHAGELIGVAAVEGAGQRELLRVLGGRLAPTSGSATLPARVGFVPEDRQRDAVVLDAPLLENVALRGAGSRRGTIDWRQLRTETAQLMASHDVRAQSADALMSSLSGGNQQKLVMGRELADRPQALIVENPTRGLDIRATAAIHRALLAARDGGTTVVLYSTDLDEVLSLADRVLVVANGHVSEHPNDRDEVGRAMLAARA